jgi:hypothetical protein
MYQYTLISLDEAIERAKKRQKFYIDWLNTRRCSGRNVSSSHVWAGYKTREEELEKTIEALHEGNPCARSVAQLFARGYRVSLACKQGDKWRLLSRKRLTARETYDYQHDESNSNFFCLVISSIKGATV